MNNTYIPEVVRIEKAVLETPDVKTFFFPASAIKLSAGSRRRREKYPLNFTPGQFVEVSSFGEGEVPISIASSPGEDYLKISFKRMGSVSGSLFNLKEKDFLGIRGPFGNGFPLKDLTNKKIILIAGGIGIAPLRSLLKYILSKKKGLTQDVVLLYGARTPQELLYKKELESWKKLIRVLLTVDRPDNKWKGRRGVVVGLLNEIKDDLSQTKAFICGPEIMMRFTVGRLMELGMPPSNIILSLERYMKCGVGKCGHCYIADKFVCRDGPVFSYKEISNLVPEQIL